MPAPGGVVWGGRGRPPTQPRPGSPVRRASAASNSGGPDELLPFGLCPAPGLGTCPSRPWECWILATWSTKHVGTPRCQPEPRLMHPSWGRGREAEGSRGRLSLLTSRQLEIVF